MKYEMCITQFVFGDYTRYIPLYIYSVLKAYPEYYLKIFVGGRLNQSEAEALALMPSGNYEIIEGYCEDKVKKGKWCKYVRRLVPFEEYKEFKYVYHGDVDFIILPETPGLKEWHIAHCKKHSLPFSNAVRPGTKRISGLHFIDVKPYYEQIGDTLAHYRAHPEEVEAKLVKTSDEWFTYDILEETFGLDSLIAEGFNRPEHGIHLALWRKSTLVKKTLQHRFDYFLRMKSTINFILDQPKLNHVVEATKSAQLSTEIKKCKEFFKTLTPDVRSKYGF